MAWLTRHIDAPVFFLDDIPHNIDSVAECAPHVHRIHFIADPRLAGLIGAAKGASARIDAWHEAHDSISEKSAISKPMETNNPFPDQRGFNGLCRDCFAVQQVATPARARCRQCGSPRMIVHDALAQLGIAHLDCDAFYASVEKRDNPDLNDKPVIIGGGRRGVVSTCCYIARIHGVHSAMPMFKALKACPDAVVIKPDMDKYTRIGKQVRALMKELTPLVEPLSIDEAFMDLRGTERLHHGTPAESLVRLTQRIESEIGITVSIGLSHNKFLAKLASDLNKPRGFSVIGETETLSFLAGLPVSAIWGVGKAMQEKLSRDAFAPSHNCRKYPMSSWRAAMTVSASGWGTWRAAKTGAKCSHPARPKVFPAKPLFRKICATGQRWKTFMALERTHRLALQSQAKGGQNHCAEAENRPFHHTDAQSRFARPDPACRYYFPDRSDASGASAGGTKVHRLSSYRHWRCPACRCRYGRPARFG